MNNASSVSALFTNVQFVKRISYKSGPPSPTLFWYKCNSGDITNNTIYNYATNTHDSVTGNPSFDTSHKITGLSSLLVNPNGEGTQYIFPPFINFGNYNGNTFSMWFRGTNPSLGNGLQRLALFSTGTSYNPQSEMLRLGNNFWEINGIDIMYVDSTNTMQEISHNTSTNTPLADQTWHHLVWILGNTTSHKIYIDGSLFFTYTPKAFNYYCNGTASL